MQLKNKSVDSILDVHFNNLFEHYTFDRIFTVYKDVWQYGETTNDYVGIMMQNLQHTYGMHKVNNYFEQKVKEKI